MTPFIVTPSGPLAKFLFPVPMTLCSGGLEVLFPKGGMFISRDNNEYIEMEINNSIWPLWTPHAFESTGK